MSQCKKKCSLLKVGLNLNNHTINWPRGCHWVMLISVVVRLSRNNVSCDDQLSFLTHCRDRSSYAWQFNTSFVGVTWLQVGVRHRPLKIAVFSASSYWMEFKHCMIIVNAWVRSQPRCCWQHWCVYSIDMLDMVPGLAKIITMDFLLLLFLFLFYLFCCCYVTILFCCCVVVFWFSFLRGWECRYLTQNREQKFVLQAGFTSCKTAHINERRESTATHFLQLFPPSRFSICLFNTCLSAK